MNECHFHATTQYGSRPHLAHEARPYKKTKQNKTKNKTKKTTTICFTTLIFAWVRELVKYSLDAV